MRTVRETLRDWRGEPGQLVGLSVLAVLAAVLVMWQGSWASIDLLLIPLVLGSLLVSPRRLAWFVILVLALAVLAVAVRSASTPRTATSVAVVFLLGLVVLLTAFRRSQLGVAGVQGESMFVDLRDRILRQATVPDLPGGWWVETALTSAGGTLFAGDFIVAARTGERVEIALVDVSGKGVDAGTRALLLSGALGGLVGSVTPAEFLPRANAYLLRQQWEEGFATAVHVSVDLPSGAFEVRTAGHPPAAHRLAGSGRWARLDSSGPILGLIEEADYEVAAGTLAPGDSLLLYTDGVVEERSRDIDLGLDRLLGEAELQLAARPEGAAQRLVDALGARDDDRAMVIIGRV
jgi:hypothetical protein